MKNIQKVADSDDADDGDDDDMFLFFSAPNPLPISTILITMLSKFERFHLKAHVDIVETYIHFSPSVISFRSPAMTWQTHRCPKYHLHKVPVCLPILLSHSPSETWGGA
jgi:hypothetical protein